jgi:lipopolysaccharide/colanic/teichoic acid biosynthesis glycosyltransferase
MMYDRLKRVFDLTVALVGLAVLTPLFAVVAMVIKLDSNGPVFYLGQRIGRLGQAFKIYKFRTMTVGAESFSTTTAQGDARITRAGNFLRKYKIDELPQLINVIKGEMSLVGPRPEVEEHTRVYSDEEKLILDVLPGITDYSSIRFARLNEILGSENPHELYITKFRAEKNQLRLRYVRSRSFVEDLKIILLTFVTIVRMATGPREKVNAVRKTRFD